MCHVNVEVWFYENVNLILLWISRVLGTRWQCITVFCKKILNKCEKADFLQIRHFFIAKMGKAPCESWTKQATYCTVKTLSGVT